MCSLLWSRISDWQKSSSMEIYTTASVNLNQFLNNMGVTMEYW